MTNRFRESMSFTHPLPVRKHSAGATDIATATAAGDVNSDDEDSSSADGSDGTRAVRQKNEEAGDWLKLQDEAS
ncbi:hypothetical protein E4U39_006277 [Claviceps sp. Clav50 group G5]|nr:hypothetical protein E4U39_006277 [Claviceps sp. Clav50 group G5]